MPRENQQEPSGIGVLQFLPRSQTRRVTPAMEMGLTDYVWTIAELLNG